MGVLNTPRNAEGFEAPDPSAIHLAGCDVVATVNHSPYIQAYARVCDEGQSAGQLAKIACQVA